MIQKRKCIICGKEFKIKTQGVQGKVLSKGFRGKNCRTCSKKCSKIYTDKTKIEYALDKKEKKHEM